MKERCSNNNIPPAPIFLTIHLSNFEWASAHFALRGYQGCILTQRFKNDRLTPIFRRLRESSGQKAVTQESSMIRFLKMILRGTPVGILGDLTMKTSQPAVIIQAFGLRMRVTTMHAILHKRQTPLSNPLSHCCNQTDDTWYDFLSRYNLARKCPINRLHKHVGTSLSQRFGSIQSNGFGSTSTGDIAQSKTGTVIPSMLTNLKNLRGN